jgi:hypothetical protein
MELAWTEVNDLNTASSLAGCGANNTAALSFWRIKYTYYIWKY